MKRIVVLLAALVLLLQCSNDNKAAGSNTKQDAPATTAASAFRSVSPQVGKMLIDSKQDMVLLDVRTPQELQRYGTIAGSHLTDFGAIMQNRLNIPKDRPVLVFCAVGGRSYFAGQVLAKYGYQEVYNLAGGIDGWSKAGYPLVR